MGRALQDEPELLRMLKQLKYLGKSPRVSWPSSSAALHAALKGEGPCCPGRFGPLAHVEASEVLLKLTQESAGHPAVLAVQKKEGMGRASQDDWCSCAYRSS